MNKYEKSLKQFCIHCSTSKANFKKDKCNRYSNIKELVDGSNDPVKLIIELLGGIELTDLKHVKRACNELIREKTLKEVE